MFRKSRGLWDALFFYIQHAPTKLCRKSADLSDPPMHRDPGLRIGGGKHGAAAERRCEACNLQWRRRRGGTFCGTAHLCRKPRPEIIRSVDL